MTEQEGSIVGRGQNELTNQPNSSNLEREGDNNFMDGTPNGNGPEQPPRGPNPEEARRRQEETQRARDELFSLPGLPDNIPLDLKNAYEERKRELAIKAGVLGQATWRNNDSDSPVVITGYKGKGPDGRDYMSIEGSETGIPFDEIEYAEEQVAAQGPDATQGYSSLDKEALKQKMFEADRKRIEETSARAREIGSQMGLPEDVIEDFIKETSGIILGRKMEAINELIERGAIVGDGALETNITVPESLEDLAKLVMKRSAPQWRKGGEKALIKEDGSVNTENFLDWSRHNILKVHNNNPTDPVNFFSDIGTNIRTDLYGGAISFYEITFGDSYFLQDKGGGKKVINEEYQALHDQLLYETFLLMLLRNPDITYTSQARAQKDKMLQALTEALTKNPLTRSNFFEFIFSMPSTQRDSIADISSDSKGKEFTTRRESNFYVGNAAREAMAAYMNIFDYDQLVNILGENAPLLRIKLDEDGKPVDSKDAEMIKKGWFNKDGTIRRYAVDLQGRHVTRRIGGKEEYIDDPNGLPHPKYMSYINIFLGATPDQRQQADIREKIRLSIMQKEGVSHEEAELAELFAYTMTHINGVAARNDVDSVAFDWWTRLTNFKDKRKREKAEKRGSKWGMQYNLEGFKRIGLSFFEGARDVNERSIQSIIMGTGKNKDGSLKLVDIDGNPLKNIVDYERERVGNDELIVFYDKSGRKVSGLHATKFRPITEQVEVNGKKTKVSRVEFLDSSGRVVEVGENKAKVKIEKVKTAVEFKADLQKQFLPNHVVTGAGIYEFIINKAQMAFPEMVVGRDTYGNPILDQKKVDEVKESIEHDIRYMCSTWPEINFAEEALDWERIEVRSGNGRLVAKKRAEDGSEQELDNDWYILDKNGKRTEQRNEPETFVRSRVMTRLESMFGADALKFIQYEVEKRGLEFNSSKDNEDKRNIKTIQGRDWAGNAVETTVDLTHATNDEFKIAVWRGAFDYLIAAEIMAHRDRGSGYSWYNAIDMKKTNDALVTGEFITPDQVKKIRSDTKTKARRLYRDDIAFAMGTGSIAGFWAIFKILMRDLAR